MEDIIPAFGKILLISQTTGNTSGMGVTASFGWAMVDCTNNYIDKVYKKNIKKLISKKNMASKINNLHLGSSGKGL
jgi:hypothetical protein